MHVAAAAGSSIEFKEYREYQPGDDVKRIDWSAYGRSDRLVVKDYREEVRPVLDILIDGSRSMALEGTLKAAAALGLAGLLAAAAGRAGYSHGSLDAPYPGRSDRQLERQRGPLGRHRVRLRRESRRLAARAGVAAAGLARVDQRSPVAVEPRAVVGRLAERAAGLIVVMVLGRADVEPPPRGNVRLEDVDGGGTQEIFVDGAAVARYRAALARHRESWYGAARSAGAAIATVIAEQVVDDWRLDELTEAGVLMVR